MKTPGTPSAGYWWLGLLLHGVAGLAVLGAAQARPAESQLTAQEKSCTRNL